MRYTTHIITTCTVATPIMQATGTLTVINLASLCIGAVLPDIDEPQSYIGKKTRGISDLINLMFGHRGMTHTLLASVVVMLIMIVIGAISDYSVPALCLGMGYFLHILGDSFSKSGVRWLFPFTKKFYKPKYFYYITGTFSESIVFTIFLAILILEVWGLKYSLKLDLDFLVSKAAKLLEYMQRPIN